MSSIYKKGRDGYYYYQTYVYNPETKKKDKRIFHALGTKDLLEAKTKQHELDLQHEKQSYINPSSSRLLNKFKNNPTMAIIVGAIAITILLVNFFRPNNVKQNLTNSIITEKVVASEEKIDVIPKTFEPVKLGTNQQEVPNIDNIPEILKTNPEPKLVESKVIIPKYTVERVDRLSDVFDQGKVYVTINKNTSNESQRLLCKNLTKRYSEFSNIVICLYANNRVGKDLANGKEKIINVGEQKRFWLAMYTYNPVEGEYFDDNPSGYLGTY
tara:strand:- start:1639 stop:2448 length:810 start_codon:yes stop_codon:yes gene_type:complete